MPRPTPYISADDVLSDTPSFSNVQAYRYSGTNLASRLSDLPSESSQAVHKLYALLLQILPIAEKASTAVAPNSFVQKIREERWPSQIAEISTRLQDISQVTESKGDENFQQRLNKNIHDLRGGALTALVLQLDWLLILDHHTTIQQVMSVFYLVRDHLKIMRNCFEDLDPDKRHNDQNENPHNTRLITEKWDGFESQGVYVRLRGSYEGNIASCCLEFSTIDRIVYNLVNNAIRHGSGEEVEMILVPDQADQPNHLLFGVRNKITNEKVKTLNQKFGSDWNHLFKGGFTTGGSGLGMRICADCVKQAYGLQEISELIDNSLLGIRYRDGSILTWFFWPLLPSEG